MTSINIGQHTIDITHPDKLLFPESNITKLMLTEYYQSVASYLLPELVDRALTIQRYPNGIAKQGFIQQHAFQHAPTWLATATLPKKTGGDMQHILCQNIESIIYLVEYGMITPHRWLSKIQHPEWPDLCIIDIDPAPDQFSLACKAAKFIKQLLDEIKLSAWVMTTGSKGLHIVIPIKPEFDFAFCKHFIQSLIQPLLETYPHEFTTEMHKEDRAGRVFIDTLRNNYGHTAVTPFAVRALAAAPVATPIAWEQLDDKHLTAQTYTIKNMHAYLNDNANIWHKYKTINEQSLKGKKLPWSKNDV